MPCFNNSYYIAELDRYNITINIGIVIIQSFKNSTKILLGGENIFFQTAIKIFFSQHLVSINAVKIHHNYNVYIETKSNKLLIKNLLTIFNITCYAWTISWKFRGSNWEKIQFKWCFISSYYFKRQNWKSSRIYQVSKVL